MTFGVDDVGGNNALISDVHFSLLLISLLWLADCSGSVSEHVI